MFLIVVARFNVDDEIASILLRVIRIMIFHVRIMGTVVIIVMVVVMVMLLLLLLLLLVLLLLLLRRLLLLLLVMG